LLRSRSFEIAFLFLFVAHFKKKKKGPSLKSRQVSFSKKFSFASRGNIYKNAIALGDVNEDGVINFFSFIGVWLNISTRNTSSSLAQLMDTCQFTRGFRKPRGKLAVNLER
jgi:hypothetical protein